jgi:hypothetical protein
MTEAASRVLEEALKLDDHERAKLASELLASLDEADEDVAEAWAREIERRATEARTSDAGEEDWRVVLDRIEREVLRG